MLYLVGSYCAVWFYGCFDAEMRTRWIAGHETSRSHLVELQYCLSKRVNAGSRSSGEIEVICE